MPIPSLYISKNGARAWSVVRAAAFGSGIGIVAALFKILGPMHQIEAASAAAWQVVGAAAAFALLCGGAAALRNLVARRLIWPEMG